MGHNDPTPFQSPPQMKLAAGLLNTNEYACIWTGQSQSRPWGTAEEAYDFAEFLRLERTGVDLTINGGVTIPDEAVSYPGAVREVGSIEVLAVEAGAVAYPGEWNSGSVYLRFGIKTAPLKGLALVIDSDSVANTITVEWIVLPANNTTPAGYLTREGPGPLAARDFYAYERVRCLTSYLPTKDIVPAYAGAASSDWSYPQNAPYPAENGALSVDGRRLLLPSPYNGATNVTTFSDLGLFLPLTRREGQDGFGISDIADSKFTGLGNPVGHPITTISGQVFTFVNALDDVAWLNITDPVDIFKQAYILVDWEQGGASKRSWGIVDTNTATTFTATGAWLGDGIPDTPATSAVTFDLPNDEVDWGGHTLVEGDPIAFHGGTMPSGIVEGRTYRVRNPVAGVSFQISESMDHAVIALGGTPAGVTAVRVWHYTVWIPNWRDNPYAWIPGPEFAYPNEDAMPAATFVHFRARGIPWWGHQEILGDGPKSLVPHDNDAEGRFGAVLPFGMHMALGIGTRVNMVILGVSGAPLSGLPRLSRAGTHNGTIGWWNHKQFGFGVALEDTTSFLAARVKRLITVIAVEALKAESATPKPLRYLSACHVQSQTDSVVDTAREMFPALVTDYRQWLRDLVLDGSWSPYDSAAKMPFVQPLQSHYPWETDGVSVQGTFQPFGVDALGEQNNTIREINTAEEFSNYVLVEDLPKLPTDFAHWSGQGMAMLGMRLGATVLEIVEHALGYTSTALKSTNSRLISIVNKALIGMGQGSRQITTLDDNTAEARTAKQLLPNAVEQVLSLRHWSWAMRVEEATQVKHTHPKWDFAYVVPERAITPVAIFDPTDAVNQSGAGTSGGGTQTLAKRTIPNAAVVPLEEPAEFEIGRSRHGHRLLYTNVPEISGDVSVAFVTDGEQHPERLPTRPTMHYVDKVLDPDRFSPSFATALSWYLAAELASALIRGDEGEQVAARCMAKVGGFVRTEAQHETSTRHLPEEHIPTWQQHRG